EFSPRLFGQHSTAPPLPTKANSLRVYSESMLSWPFFLKKNGTRRKSPLRTFREFALVKDAKAELQIARIVSLCDCSETRCTKLHARSKWVEEVGMVEQVEGLGTELAVDTLKDREV